MNDYRELIFTKKESRRRVSKSVSLKYQHQNTRMRLLTCFIKYNDDDDNDDDVRIPFMIQIKWDRMSLSASMYLPTGTRTSSITRITSTDVWSCGSKTRIICICVTAKINDEKIWKKQQARISSNSSRPSINRPSPTHIGHIGYPLRITIAR